MPDVPLKTVPVNGSSNLTRSLSRVIWVLMILASICIGRAAVSQNVNYIDLQRYAHLEEKQPFQGRILMVPVIRAAGENRHFLRLYSVLFRKTVDTPEDLAVMLVDCLCLLLMLPLTVALRRALRPRERTSWLAPAMMLLIVAFTYVVRYEQRFTMPYDFPAVLFYSLGLLAILRRNGWLLLVILAVAIPNRETAIFLIPSWFWLGWKERNRVSAIAYGAAGVAIVELWRYWIDHLFHLTHQHYEFPFRNNLMSVVLPTHWAQLLSVFGFLAIPMWMLRSYITDSRLRALWFSTIPFLLAALIVGVWRETRIFGELSALAGVTFALQLEGFLSASCDFASC